MMNKTKNGRFAIVTLGCRVNQCESDSLSQQFKDRGWSGPGPDSDPDLVVVNTCAVTAKAAMQSRQAVRKACRQHPDARVVVTGCYAQIEPGKLSRIEGVAAVCGNAEKDELDLLIEGNRKEAVSDVSGLHRFAPLRAALSTDRTRPVLKIQDGCDAFCTYCVVPHARGRSRSMPEEDVLAHIRSLEKAGFQEVVLSGIHLGAYGADRSPKSSLLALLDRIEIETSIPRIRLSSIEPGELTPGIRELAAASSRICPHFHVPLQSGDDDILKKMGRPYSAASFEALVLDLHRRMPDAAIGADVLVGFPGETERSFDRTRRFVERLPLTYLHVFPFSPRPGTPAFHFTGKVPAAVIRKRGQKLRDIGNQKRGAFLEKMRNRALPVLVEARRDPETGLLKGITGNYAAVLLEGPDSLKNRIVSCRIEKKAADSAVFGRLLPPEKAAG